MILGLFLILIVLIPFCIYLYLTNKKLQERINFLESEKKNILERKILKNNEEDIISIGNISKEINNNKSSVPKNISKNRPLPTNQDKSGGIGIQKSKTSNEKWIDHTKKLSTNINKKIIKESSNFNINDFSHNIKHNPQVIDKENKDYLIELSNSLNQNLETPPIELTAYEQEQEKEAIISYEELKLREKDKKIRIDDNDESNTFIEKLKDFRNNLNS